MTVGPRRWLWLVLVALAVAAGASYRLTVAFGLGPFTDSDEVMSSLMARDLLEHGTYPAFLWNQSNGGTLEVALVAGAQRVLGTSFISLRLVTVLLGVVGSLLVWRVGRRLADEVGGAVAGLASWLWPAGFVSWSTKEYLYYQPVLVLGASALLLSLRCTERVERRLEPVALGLVLGLGWWTSPNITYFAVPALANLVLRPAWLRRRSWLLPGPALLGALPWLVNNAEHGWRSLVVPEVYRQGTFASRLGLFLEDGVPTSLGLLGFWTEEEVVPGGRLLAAGLGALLAGGALVHLARWVRQRESPVPIDLLGLLAVPFLYAASPVNGSTELWVPRYFFFAGPFVALALGRLLAQRVLATVGVALMVGLAWLDLRPAWAQIDWTPPPDDIEVLAAALDREGVDAAFGSYWTTNRLTWASEGEVLGTPMLQQVVRDDRADVVVRGSEAPAYVFERRSARVPIFERAVDVLGVGTTSFEVANFVVHLPDRRLLPEELPPELGNHPVEGV